MDSICTTISTLSSSINAQIWSAIWHGFSDYGPYIILGFILWGIFEFVNREFGFAYRSKNGFTPLLNSFVGAGTYFLLFNLILVLPSLVFGDIVYCISLPGIIHLFIFWLVKRILLGVAFWVY